MNIPAGYHAVTPYIVAKDAKALRDFIVNVFNARELEVIHAEDGHIAHASYSINGSAIMFGQSGPHQKPFPAMLYIYVEDTDATYKKALSAGATSVREPQNMFYGDRNAAIRDSNDVEWWLATHVEEVTEEEIQRRAREMERARKTNA